MRDFNTMADRLQDLVSAQSQPIERHLARTAFAPGASERGSWAGWQRTGPEAHSVLERIELEATA